MQHNTCTLKEYKHDKKVSTCDLSCCTLWTQSKQSVINAQSVRHHTTQHMHNERIQTWQEIIEVIMKIEANKKV